MKTLFMRALRAGASRLRGPVRRVFHRRWFKSNVVQVTEICRRAAAGDLEARITGVRAGGDFARMCHAINDVLDVSDAFVREAAAAMRNCSRGRFHRPILLRGLHGSYQQSAVIINTAAVAMKGYSESIEFVGGQASETANRVHAVAAACEESGATSEEISRQTTDVARQTEAVAKQIAAVNESLQALERAVEKVEKVVDLINNVAIQTNLLGLNATIEAAHAGDFGQGFGVVAAEVKNLSQETRNATEEISHEMKHIQEAVVAVAQTVSGINGSMSELQAAAAAIAGSVREQVQATASISNSIMAVSHNTEQVSERIRLAREGLDSAA